MSSIVTNTVVKNDTTLKAPVVCDPDNPEDTQSFMAYIDEQQEASLSQVSDTEAARLAPYLDAWGRRIGQPISEPKKKSVLTWVMSLIGAETSVPHIDFAQPGTLNKLFEASSRLTKNVILAQNAIIPRTLLQHPFMQAKRENKDLTSGLVAPTHYGGAAYGVGFIQVKKRQAPNEYYNKVMGTDVRSTVFSISFPIMTLDDGMMRRMAPHDTRTLMNALQDIITASNHDPVHHLIKAHSPNNEIVENLSGSDTTRMLDDEIKKYVGQRNVDEPLGYESWAIATHAATWATMKDTPAGEGLEKSIDTYFDELERIAAALQNVSSLSDMDRHNVIDYYATAVGFSLIRLVPANDPLMIHAISRMESADPLPEAVIEAPRQLSPEADKVISLYKDAGVHFTDQNQQPMSYTAAKQMQLIMMLPDIAQMHAPAPSGSDIDIARQRINDMDRNLLRILVKPAGLTPSNLL